jgi:hypothetical protein
MVPWTSVLTSVMADFTVYGGRSGRVDGAEATWTTDIAMALATATANSFGARDPPKKTPRCCRLVVVQDAVDSTHPRPYDLFREPRCEPREGHHSDGDTAAPD